MPGEPRLPEITEDGVLGGRLRLRQPTRGHRFGHDAILLAAACPARVGERAVDLGAGVGAAGLALAARVPGVDVTLVEIDAGLAALASDNAKANGLSARVNAVVLDVTAPAHAFADVGLGGESVVRVLMNPPFSEASRQNLSPDRQRRLAHAGDRTTLAAWIRTAARLLKPGGTLSLIWRADALPNVLAALERGFGAIAVVPVHPKSGEPAIRVLVVATKASRAPLRLLPAVVLNDRSGRPTPEAESILRAGTAVALPTVDA